MEVGLQVNVLYWVGSIMVYVHRGGRGVGEWAKPSFFGQTIHFWAEASSQKRKQIFFLYLLNKRTKFIQYSEMKCLKSVFLNTSNYWMGRVGQNTILN